MPRRPHQQAGGEDPLSPGPPRRGPPGILLAVGAGLAFLPVLRNGFVDWDDHRMFLDNPHLRGLSRETLAWAWTTGRLGEYMPVTWASYAVDHALWGLDAWGYHLTSLVLHVGATLAVAALARRLIAAGGTESSPEGVDAGVAVAALLFAVHPLRVEPVAWASARGTVLGGLLLLLAALLYVEGARRGADRGVPGGWLAASVSVFAVALLARATGLVLPLVLLLLDAWPLRRLPPGWWRPGPAGRRVLLEKLAFAGPALVSAVIAVRARLAAGDPARAEEVDLAGRLAGALHAWATYLRQALYPWPLSPVYEEPARLTLLAWPAAGSAAVVLGLGLLVLALARRWPAGLVTAGCSVVLLVPVSGLVPFALVPRVADRYTYLAAVPWAVVAGGAVTAWWAGWRAGRRSGAVLAAGLAMVGLLVGGLGVLTWRQAGIWRDSLTLWRHGASVAPGSAIARVNLGVALERAGRVDLAVDEYRRAAAIWPGRARVRLALGRALWRLGRPADAKTELGAAARLAPGDPVARLALGVALASRGDVTGAIEQYEAALRLDPG